MILTMTEYVVFIRYRNEYAVAFVNAIGADAAIEFVEERLPVADYKTITERRVIPVSEMKELKKD